MEIWLLPERRELTKKSGVNSHPQGSNSLILFSNLTILSHIYNTLPPLITINTLRRNVTLKVADHYLPPRTALFNFPIKMFFGKSYEGFHKSPKVTSEVWCKNGNLSRGEILSDTVIK